MKLPNCKVTVIKRTHNKDLISQYLVEEFKEIGPCEKFKVGQEFMIDPNLASVPTEFCDWAWLDIRNDIKLIASGGNIPAINEQGVAITGCSDWFRPVYFKIERLE